MAGAKRRRWLYTSGVACLATGLVAITLTAGTASATQKPHSSAGGVVNWAEQPQGTPNFIFPFAPIQYFSTANISQFQWLMYRPLYFFGNGSQPTLNTSLSLAQQPVYSNGDKTVTIDMKTNYKYSNGEPVDAQGAVFWFNMLKTDKAGWAAYAPGTIPDDISSVTAPSKYKLVIDLTGPVNSYWFTYNELSQVTPFPMAWDVTSTAEKSPAACGTSTYAAVTVNSKDAPVSAAATSCNSVYTFLSSESGYNPSNPKAANNSMATYASNPLWQVVDGPWHLAAFNASGDASFKPNAKYDGPVKASISEFNELPFTSTSAEYSALLGGKLQYGYLPPEDVTSSAKSATSPGANPASLSGKFNIHPIYTWSINYFPYNFNSTGDGGEAGKIFQQLYFRQAFQELVDQNLFISKLYKGYAVPTNGPVPVEPSSPFVSSYEKNNPYPYSPSKAATLLKDNGWKVVPNGTSTCEDAAKCGVPKGTPLSFTMQYVNNSPVQQEQANAEQASWASAGIKVALTSATFDTVIGNALACKPGPSCSWELENWGGGWLYAPDFYPTGEEIFQTGAGSNVGSYSSSQNDSMIHATDFTSTGLTNWENYIAKNLPFVWQPDEAYEIYETSTKLSGATPISPLLTLTPENMKLSS